MLTMISSGCVALNLPSERYHDPTDHGGIFGSWKTGVVDPAATQAFAGPNHGHSPNGMDHAAGAIGSSVDCSLDYIGGESLAVDPFDTENGEYAKPPEPPEVPWPRFHPVPTRPIFGG
ncbi:hypothetical protein LF1_42210 [Rubripirellula obstinata]|uniref:Uncharacterized protein n=2 Tax=Rubripirellula obstinata TaxID=406547 RepID=A0A5B1CM94_9BACT|nr:hypothetical protein [Rubripirellula obstinata]KAA1261666.1 hypothetical protein LF1_42210 [Rubripirellula obstinata]